MIYYPLTHSLRSREFPLLANPLLPSLAQDGQAMIRGMYGNTFGIQPCSGSAGEVFVGFLLAQMSSVPFLQTTAVKVETFTLSSGKTVTLSKAPNASATLVQLIVGGSGVTNTTVAPDSVNTTTGVVDLTTAGVAGYVYQVTYRYSLSVVEARSRNGDVTPGGYAGLTTGTCGVMISGTIYTDQFDTTKNWALAAGASVKMTAGGLISDTSGSGVAISSAVIAVPSIDFPFLGVSFDTY